MDRDDFIITVYCLVCDQYRALFSEHPLRHGGITPQLTDEEVITLEICGEYFKLNTDKDLFNYFRQHYPAWFPRLRDRSLFVRQAANLWQAKAALQQRLTVVSGQATAPVQIIDTLPLPVCVFTRSRRDRCFKPDADYGHCAARQLTYYGFKLGLRVSRSHDIQVLDELVENFVGLVPADKGFIDEFRQALLAEHGVLVITSAPQSDDHDGATARTQSLWSHPQMCRDGRFPVSRTLRGGTHSRARPVAFPTSPDSQSVGAYRRRVSQSPTRPPASLDVSA